MMHTNNVLHLQDNSSGHWDCCSCQHDPVTQRDTWWRLDDAKCTRVTFSHVESHPPSMFFLEQDLQSADAAGNAARAGGGDKPGAVSDVKVRDGWLAGWLAFGISS